MRNTITKSPEEKSQYIEYGTKSLPGQLFFFCCNQKKITCITDYPIHFILNFNFYHNRIIANFCPSTIIRKKSQKANFYLQVLNISKSVYAHLNLFNFYPVCTPLSLFFFLLLYNTDLYYPLCTLYFLLLVSNTLSDINKKKDDVHVQRYVTRC